MFYRQRHFFANLSAIFALRELTVAGLCLLILSGCGKKKSAPEYDTSNSQRLLKICENLQAGEVSEALSLAKESPLPGSTSLTEILSNHQARQLAVQQANDALAASDFDRLEDIVQGAEAKGLSSPDILRIRTVPQALHALESFCARTPWESSHALAEALNWLQPHLEQLEQAPSFQDYLASQQALLQKMRQQERESAINRLTAEFDGLILTGRHDEFLDDLQQLQKLSPAHSIFEFLSADNGQWQGTGVNIPLTIPADWSAGRRQALELALAAAGGSLPEAARQRASGLLASLQAPLTLSGAVMKALVSERLEDSLSALTRWQAEMGQTKPPADLLQICCRRLLPGLTAAQIQTSSCPGPQEILTTLNIWARDGKK